MITHFQLSTYGLSNTTLITSLNYGFDLPLDLRNIFPRYSSSPKCAGAGALVQLGGLWISHCLCSNGSVRWAIDGVQILLIQSLQKALWCGGTWKAAAGDPGWSLTIIKYYHTESGRMEMQSARATGQGDTACAGGLVGGLLCSVVTRSQTDGHEGNPNPVCGSCCCL